VCFCLYNLESIYQKYREFHPAEAVEIDVHCWFSALDVSKQKLSKDGQTMFLLYELSVKYPIKRQTK
jgi:hypothetical protein